MRRPIYTKTKTHRIISMANELWACQDYKPTKHPDKCYDLWHATHRPTSKEEALRQLSTFGAIES